MNYDILCYCIKYLGINITLSICYNKIINNSSSSIVQKFVIIITTLIVVLLQVYIQNITTNFFVFIPSIFIYGLLFSYTYKNNIVHSIVVTIISLATALILSLITIAIISFTFAYVDQFHCFNNDYPPSLKYILTISMSCLNVILAVLTFKIRKLKYGFSFLKNDYLKLQLLLLTIIVIFGYSIGTNFSKKQLACSMLVIILFALIILKQVFNLYQKQKLQLQTLKDYEKELSDIKEELRITKEEKEKIIKSNHEFYHRQEALKNKLNTLLNNNYSTEMSNELTNIASRINNLSSEYEDKLKSSPKIDTCGIEEIDDMLTYFQNECNNNNIEFICKFDGNINKIINNVITLSQFETLLGDLIRNSIIAINHTSNENRNIMLVFGLKNEVYELDIYDSGVNFEIETLLKLGLEKCSTHLNEGGTGIGFITTFETLQNTKSSLIITEMNSGNYSKCIGIRFDGNSNYIIDSYRIDSIKAQNITSRKIMFQNSNK